MLYPQESAEDWSKKYKLEIKVTRCLHCKQEQLINIPIATKEIRGFKTPDHGCPKEYDQYYFSTINKNALVN